MNTKKQNKTRILAVGKVFLLLAILTLSGCNQQKLSSGKIKHEIVSPTLAPDNSSVVFAMCDITGQCDIATYTISSKKISRTNPTGQDCLAPIYSPDGKLLAFASGEGDNRNIFVMNSDGSGLRQLTHTVNDKNLRENGASVVRINGGPSFSSDGANIIFARSGVRRQRSMGGDMVSHWDLYELDVATGQEKRLTDYSYYRISRPYYLPAGKGFIFSGSGPKGTSLLGEMFTRNENELLVMSVGQPTPHRPFEHNTYAVEPTVSLDGTIVFVSRSNEFDGVKGSYYYDLFIHKGGISKRLTTERFATIIQPFISFDGTLVVFLASKKQQGGQDLWTVNSDGTGLNLIGRPCDESKN
jgi:Tol biopolymer transport system component